MTTSLYWQRQGSGTDLVLIHGWGMNGAVWQQIVDQLSQHFTLHVVDLPGYGNSHECEAKDIEAMTEILLESAPCKAIWVGWSLGGIVAAHVALHFPERVSKLVTVASSPKFAAESGWRGIKPSLLSAFTEQLVDDFQTTIERFMALQAMGSPTARQDVKKLKKIVLSRPIPNQEALLLGLAMLKNIDLRPQLSELGIPFLRMYGRLDGLVPVTIADELNKALPNSPCVIFSDSSHAPFMTEPDAFCEQLIQFSNTSGYLASINTGCSMQP